MASRRGKRNNRRGGLPVKLTPKNFLKKNRHRYMGGNSRANAYIKKTHKQRGSGVPPLSTTQLPPLDLEIHEEEGPLDLLEVWPGRRIEVELEEEELADRSPSGFLISDKDLGVTELERDVMEAILEDDADEARKIILEGANMVPVLVRVLQRDDIDPKWVSWLIGMGVDRELMLNGYSCLPQGVGGGTRTVTDANLPARMKKLQRLREADCDFTLADASGETAFHKLVNAAEEQIHKSMQASIEAGPQYNSKAEARRKLAQFKKEEVLRRLAGMWSEMVQLRPEPQDVRSLAQFRTPELLGHVKSVLFETRSVPAR